MKKKTVILSLLFLIIPLISTASFGTATRIGDTVHYNFSDGTNGTATRIGDTVHYNFSDGTNGTATRIGDTVHYNFSDGTNGTGGGMDLQYFKQLDLFNTCSELNSSEYPDYVKETSRITRECISEKLFYNDGVSDYVNFSNNLNMCRSYAPEKAYKEIKNICIELKNERYLKKMQYVNEMEKITVEDSVNNKNEQNINENIKEDEVGINKDIKDNTVKNRNESNGGLQRLYSLENQPTQSIQPSSVNLSKEYKIISFFKNIFNIIAGWFK